MVYGNVRDRIPPNRIREWRVRRGLTLERLEELTGIDLKKLSRIERGDRRLNTADLATIASALGVNQSELLSLNTAAVTDPIAEVPLISWVNAGRLAEAADPYPVGMAESFITLATRERGLFALRVVGNSMNRVAPDGATIIVKPGETTLISGKCYIIKDAAGDVTFKRFRPSPDRFEPFSTEDDHVTVFPAEGMQIVGRVVKVVTDL